jgi:hypothetical protein
VQPTDLTEFKKITESGRIKVTGYPNTLALKPENLIILDDTKDEVDWTCSDTVDDNGDAVSLSLADIVMRTRIGLIDRCDEFVATLNSYFLGPEAASMPRHKLTQDSEIIKVILNSPCMHCMYTFHLEQIGHSFILETYEGLGRLYQTAIKTDGALIIRHGQEVAISTGYSAIEWVSPKSCEDWTDVMKTAHFKWGGGRRLTWNDLEHLFQLLFELQRSAEAIADSIYTQLPLPLVDADEKWMADASSGNTPANLLPSMTWSQLVLANPRGISIVRAPEGVQVFSNDAYEHTPYTFLIPSTLAEEFNVAYAKLVGEYPPPGVYLYTLHYKNWKTMLTPDRSAIGWAISLASVPH